MLDVDLESGTEIFNVADDPTSPPLLSPLPLCRDSCGQFRSVISDKNESKKTQLESARNGSKESLEGEEENQNFRSLWDKAPSEVLIGPGRSSRWLFLENFLHMAMDQYLLISFLGG